MALTLFAVQNAKPKEKPYKLSDGGGLHLLVTRESKLWRLRYRFGGKENMLSLGTFPEVSIADARAKRDDARKLLAKGEDPSQQRKLDKIAAATAANNTFGVIAEEHLDNLRKAGRAEATIIKHRWFLRDLASPLTKRPIAEITPAEILVILKKGGSQRPSRNGKEAPQHDWPGLQACGVHSPRYERPDLRSARGAPTSRRYPPTCHYARRRIWGLLLSLNEYQGWTTVRTALQFLMLTMTRPGETRLMRRGEIIWQTSTWRIPAERMKMRRPHDVPLSKQALAVCDLPEPPREVGYQGRSGPVLLTRSLAVADP
jgi:hypothetical protein